MNRIIPLKIQDEHIKKTTNIAGAAGSFHVVTLELTFSETWANTAKKVYFFDAYGENSVCVILTAAMLKPGFDETYCLSIPPEPLAQAGEMTLTISGADTLAVPARMIRSVSTTFEVLPSDLPTADHIPLEPTPGLSDQLQSEINALKAGIDTVTNGLTTVNASVTASASSATASANSASQSDAARLAANAAKLAAEAASTSASHYATQSETSAAAAAQSAKDAATALKPPPSTASNSKMLDTSTKIQKFLQSDKTDVNYQYIYDQYQEFIAAATTGTTSVQAKNRDGNLLYWTDATHKTASTDVSAFPVYVYDYKETTKLKFGFHLDPSGSGFYIPLIELGEGNGVGNHAKGYIYKGVNGLYLDYYSDTDGSLRRILLGDNGISITPYDLQNINFYANGFSVQYSGETLFYTWTMNAAGAITALTTANQVQIPITWNTSNL